MMGFSSQLYSGETIIHDTTPDEHFMPDALNFGHGLDLSERTEEGYKGTADMFPEELLIPTNEFQARIKEKEERKNRISDHIRLKKLKSKNQRNLNYCWVFAPTHCDEIVKCMQNQPYVDLSPASVGAKITGFRNQGGWGKPALDYIREHGVVPARLWPDTSLEHKYDTSEAWQAAQANRVLEWYELKPRNIQQLVSCLLINGPVAVGYNWWGHEVTACDAVWLDGTIAIRIRNQWWLSETQPWGDDNFGILQGSKMYPDDAVVPRSAIAA